MDRVAERVAAGSWPEARERDRVTLTYLERHRRRRSFRADNGTEFLLDLPQAAHLREGDGLRLEGGGFVRVRAADEALLEIRAATPEGLARLAWHIGNRHIAAAIESGRILIERDPVIGEMLRGLGAATREIMAPFDPEPGAYAAAPHYHGAGHEHGHGHEH
jgi:urease accessory protein